MRLKLVILYKFDTLKTTIKVKSLNIVDMAGNKSSNLVYKQTLVRDMVIECKEYYLECGFDTEGFVLPKPTEINNGDIRKIVIKVELEYIIENGEHKYLGIIEVPVKFQMYSGEINITEISTSLEKQTKFRNYIIPNFNEATNLVIWPSDIEKNSEIDINHKQEKYIVAIRSN